MILGVGVDFVAVARMRRVLSTRWAKRFISRVFCVEEIATCENTAEPAQGYAARFAAKEAMAKALGTGFSKGISPRAIEVRGGERTRPAIVLKDAAQYLAESMGVTAVHVSLTHTQEAACAFVVVEKAD